VDVRDLHRRAMSEFDARIREVPVDRWDDPTPCPDWSVRELVAHVVSEQFQVPERLGAAPQLPGDDPLGDDPEAAWATAAEAAGAATEADDALEGTVQTPSGPLPAETYLRRRTLDLAVHAWDLARATGTDERLDEELVEVLLEEVGGERGDPEAFAEPVRVQPSADAQTRLLALLGRTR
jgi:uncharacterized protein (TIGR03086 family)